MSTAPAQQQMSESEFRTLAQETFRRVERGFEDVDPDEAEAEESLGTLTITLGDGTRWVLSVQPPVRQVWLAVASIGRAFHFDYDPATGTWQDDRGEGIELMRYLEDLLRDVARVDVRFH